MTFLKPVCYLALCLALIVGTPLAAQTAEDEGYQPPATNPGQSEDPKQAFFRTPKDRSPDAAAGTSFVRVRSNCLHGGHLMQLSWKMRPDHDDVRVAITVQIPGDVPLRLNAAGAAGQRTLALTPAGKGRATLEVNFIDDRSRVSARGHIALPFPDTGVASVEAVAEKSRLRGALTAEITECPPSRKTVGAVRSEDNAERAARASEDDERRDLQSLTPKFQRFIFGAGSVGGQSSGPFGGPSTFTSNETAFDREKMATCIEREMYDRNAMGYAYAIVQNKQIFTNSIGAAGWARSPFEGEADSISVAPTTPMMVASVSKPITAMAIMKLVQDQALSLDDAFYPLVASEYPQAGSGVDQITIRELLQHNSGLKPNYCGKTAESIEADAGGPKNYQNINYCVLREVVEHVSGSTYVDYVRAELLEPSGIGGMSCAPDSANPTVYYTDGDEETAGLPFSDYTDLCGAYGWYASARDLGQILAHYRNNTVLSQQIAAQMRSDCNGSRCLGISTITTSEGIAWGHSGKWTIGGQGSRAGVVRFPRGIDAAIVINSEVGKSGAAILRDAFDQSFDGGCLAPPEPPGPPSCPPTGCGTAINGLCAIAGDFPDGTQTQAGFNPFIPQNHPDGAAAYNLYCEDYPEIADYNPDADPFDLVCARANLSSGGPYSVCKGCGVDGKFWPGCECDPNQPDSCGAGLTCFGASGYGNGSTSYSSGKCWSDTGGPPIWECEADCTAVYGGTGYCHHGALPWEAAGTPICASTLCDLGGKQCAESGLFCNADTGDCEVECNGELNNPDQGLFSCQGRGYGSEFSCNLDSQRCFISGVAHP